MPLQQLVSYFNQRFSEEQGLSIPPLALNGQVVKGHCDGAWFGSILQPVYTHTDTPKIMAYDAALQVTPEARLTSGLFSALDRAGTESGASLWNEIGDHTVVHLDRLSRTVHMLNFLVFSHEVRSLFLHVHPRHMLAVEKDHGAYFEEVILRCGLLPKRIVITLPVNRAYANQTSILLNRLRNYRDRGYATALKFEDNLEDARYLEFLTRFTPDFVRFDRSILEKRLKTNAPNRYGTSSLLEWIRQQDTQLLVEGIRTRHDAEIVDRLQPDAVQGDYFRVISRVDTEETARAVNY